MGLLPPLYNIGAILAGAMGFAIFSNPVSNLLRAKYMGGEAKPNSYMRKIAN